MHGKHPPATQASFSFPSPYFFFPRIGRGQRMAIDRSQQNIVPERWRGANRLAGTPRWSNRSDGDSDGACRRTRPPVQTPDSRDWHVGLATLPSTKYLVSIPYSYSAAGWNLTTQRRARSYTPTWLIRVPHQSQQMHNLSSA